MHTKEPWKVYERKLKYKINGAEKMHTERSIGTEYDYPQLGAPYPVCGISTGLGAEPGQLHHFVSISEDNARRIVACVNACAGIPTESLEQKTVVISHDYNLSNIKQQRDDLLAALKGLVDCISETRGKNADDALFKANTAISKAEGL